MGNGQILHFLTVYFTLPKFWSPYFTIICCSLLSYVLLVKIFFTGTDGKDDFTGNSVITGKNLEHYCQQSELAQIDPN